MPKIEKITRDITLTHLFLMFGYQMFSWYFPLFLLERSFSLPQIGYANFLIYLPIAVFAPLVGYLNHKINPAVLAALGILGYGWYALGMIIYPNLPTFYLFQFVLGVSASLFFVSSRTILMESRSENYDRSFAWYYSAPSYSSAVAPAIGALLIWRFDILTVFWLSAVIQILCAVFCLVQFRNRPRLPALPKNYLKIMGELKERGAALPVLTSFLVLILAGFNNTFFILFLKNIGLSHNQILLFNSILYLIFLPVSFWLIKQVARVSSQANVARGAQIVGFFSMLLGGLIGILNVFLVFFIVLGQYVGGLMVGSGRSGLLSTKFKNHVKEAAALDTIFSPLATALGSLIGGFFIPLLGYPLLFIIFGASLFGVGQIGKFKLR